MKTPTVHPWADQEQLEAIFGTFGEGLIVLDLEGNILYMNPAALGMRRYRELWESKKNVRDFVGAFDLYDQDGSPMPTGEWPLARVLQGRTYANLEVREQDSRTAEVRVMSYSSSLLHRDGEAALGIVTVRDITERKRAEERLEQRARQQSAVAELGLEALQNDDIQALMNEATRRLAEALRVEYCKVLELLPAGDALLLKAGIGWKEGYVGEATVGTEKSSQAGYTLRSMNPVIVRDLREEERFSGPALLHEHGIVSGLSVIIYAGKQPYGVLGAHTTQKRGFSDDDVNVLQAVANLLGEVIVRQRLLDALRESEAGFRRLFENNPHPMWVYDLSTLAFLEINTAAVKRYGYARDELLKMRLFDLLPPEEAPRLLETLQRGPEAFARPATWRHSCKSGEIIVVEVSSHHLESGFSGHQAVLAVAHDITAQAEAEDRFAKAFHASPAPTAIAKLADLRFIDVNESFTKLTGYGRNELIGHTAYELNLGFEIKKRKQVLKRLKKGQPPPQLELTLKTKSGERRYVVVGTEVIDLNREPCLLDTFIDITEHKRTEEQVTRAIQTVMQDAASLSRSVMEQLTQVRAQTRNDTKLAELTKRERQVVELIARGWNNDAIALELGLKRATVRNYISRIYDKIGVHARAEAVVWARERGLVDF